MVDDWGIEVTRAEILDVNLDEATRAAMLQQLNAERARRAQGDGGRGQEAGGGAERGCGTVCGRAGGEGAAGAGRCRGLCDGVIAVAIKENGLEAAQYQVALKQVEALTAVGQGAGKQTIIVPAQALEAFGDAFKMLKGRR